MALISSPISTPQTMPVVARGSLARAPGFKYLTRAEFDAAVISERKNITLASANYAKGERLYIQGEEGYRSWFIGFGDNLTAIAATSHARTVVYSERTTRVLALDTSVAHSTEGAPEGSVGADGDEAIDRVTGHIYLKILGIWDYATTDGSYTEGAGVPGPMGPRGPIGLTGPGLLVLGVVETETDLPETGNTAGDAYLIDGDTYVWTSDEVWQNVGRFQGSKGDKGDKGDQGDIGAQGIQGIQGDTGDQGIQGPIGLPGSQGVKGDTGDQGIQGIQGIAGTKGDKGDKGDTGVAGTTTWAGITDKPTVFTPEAHTQEVSSIIGLEAALNDKQGVIATGSTAQYWRGDKTWQTLNKDAVDLGNVDNTSDADKPVSTAQAAALALKEPSIAAGTTSKYWRGDKTWQDFAGAVRSAVLTGVSTATSTAVAAADSVLVAIGKLQAQVNLRAPLASPTLTGTPTTSVQATTDNSTQIVSSYWVRIAMSNIASAAGFLTLFSSNGYVKFPSWLGGALVQWGGGTANAANGESGTTFSFPLAWPNACWRMVSSDGGSAVAAVAASAINNSTYRAWTRDVRFDGGSPYASFDFSWIAIGH